MVFFCIAQVDDSDKEGDDIKAVRMAYMTDQLKTITRGSTEVLGPFTILMWKRLEKARRANTGDVVKQQEAVVNVRKKYKDNFKRVVGSDERAKQSFLRQKLGFRNMIRNEWQKRHPNAKQQQATDDEARTKEKLIAGKI